MDTVWEILDWKTCDGGVGSEGEKLRGQAKEDWKPTEVKEKKMKFFHQVSGIPRVSSVGSCSINKI